MTEVTGYIRMMCNSIAAGMGGKNRTMVPQISLDNACKIYTVKNKW